MTQETQKQKKMPWWGWALLGLAVAGLVVLYFWLKNTGRLAVFSSVEAFRAYVSGFGVWAPLIFFLLQAAQVVAAPIPGNVTALAGGAMFGFWPALGMSVTATVLGSAIAFALAKAFGRPLVVRMVGQQVVEKYVDVVARKGTWLLFAMFLIPFFPDDALCFIAGLTAISWPLFLIIVIIARPPGLIFSTLVGSGQIVMPIWGWVLIGAAALGLMVLSFRYGEKINDWLMEKLMKNKKA